MGLPTSRSFVDHLITEIAGFNSSPSGTNSDEPEQSRTQTVPQNPFTRLPATQIAKVKPIVLTLHCLFPNDFLPALDILDRRLVQRLVHAEDKDSTPAVPDQDNATVADENTTQTTERPRVNPKYPRESMFLVTSVSAAPRHIVGLAPTSTSTSTPATMQEPEKGYEVRLDAWNCTCPTFTLSAFKDLESRQNSISSVPERHFPEMLHDQDEPVVYPFGGTLTRDTDRGSPPVCKHILACVLFARCPGLFGQDGDGRRVVSPEEIAGWCAGWGG